MRYVSKRAVSAFAGAVLLAVLALSGLFGMSSAGAATIPSAINSVTVTDTNAGTANLHWFTRLDVTAGWSVPDGSKPGDTFTMTLPPELTGLSTTFPLTTPGGASAGTCSVAGAVATCTLGDYVLGKTGVHGSLFFNARFDKTIKPGDHDLVFDAGSTHPIHVPITVVGETGTPVPNSTFHKGGWIDDNGKTIHYTLRYPVGKALAAPSTVTDVLGAGQTLDTGSFWVASTTQFDASGKPTNLVTVSKSKYTITPNATGFVFTLSMPVAANVALQITYTTTITQQLAEYTNKATLTAPGVNQSSQTEFKSYNGGGTGTGATPGPALKIVKKDSHGNDANSAAGAVVLEHGSASLVYTITNTGDEALRDIVVGDTLVANGKVSDLSCAFPDGRSATTWVGPFAAGASFTCTAKLTGVAYGTDHEDIGTVRGTGLYSGTTVTSKNAYFAKINKAVVKATTPIVAVVAVPNRIDTGRAAAAQSRNGTEIAAGVIGLTSVVLVLAGVTRRVSRRLG